VVNQLPNKNDLIFLATTTNIRPEALCTMHITPTFNYANCN